MDYDDVFAVINWNPPDRSPRSRAAGIAVIDAFFDSAPPSPVAAAISASVAEAYQLPADTATTQQPVAPSQAAAVSDQKVPDLVQGVSSPGFGQDFSTLMDDIEQLEAAAEQELQVVNAEMAENEQLDPTEQLNGFVGLHLPSMMFSHDDVEEQQQPLYSALTYSHSAAFGEQRLWSDAAAAAARHANEQYTLHHELERRQTYPLPAAPRLTPMLFASPMPDAARLPNGSINAPEHLRLDDTINAPKHISPDGTIYAPEHLPPSAGKYSMMDEMRDEEENGDLAIHSQPLPLDLGVRGRGGFHGFPDVEVFGADASHVPDQAYPFMTRDDEEELDQHDEGEGEYEDVAPEHVETPPSERVRIVTMGKLHRILAAKQLAAAARTKDEDDMAQGAGETDQTLATPKRERKDSAADALFQPPTKRAKMLMPASDDGDELESEESAYDSETPERQPLSNQVGRAWAHGMMAEKPPAALTNSVEHVSSPLTDLSDLDAPGSPDYETLAEPEKPSARPHVSEKEMKAITAESIHKTLKFSPHSWAKTRQQKQAREDAKPNASAAVQRRRQGK
ncbi:hypothetical protein LTR36_010932 [Oleoguttula mirabilis]|uniref:Uncharacterized protein n=1 Tax=Oleoguttula mirabilis TaxID=1507867 RepID=A0AAV9J3I1_9PEZI|nr:hypothetical protein LTR36_010932 [Oleoguttula mirabilis]